MIAKHVTLSRPVAEAVASQIAAGRYKDTSAALNDAAWNHFIGTASPFEEYGVTVAEVERRGKQVLQEIRRERAGGKLEAV